MIRFPGVDERTLRLFILGAALGVLLHQRHQLVLHASAVVLDKQVVAFIGDKGWGKSTTAAALHARGHWLVADDVVAIVTRDNFPVVLPGYPQVKLWSESAEALGVNPQTLSPIREGIDKYAQTTRERFTDTALPLGAVYVLGSGDELAIEPLPPPVALLQLIRNQYIAGLGTSYAQATQDDTSFLQCADVAKRVPVRLLRRPYDLASLTRLAELIEIDMRQFQPV